MSTKLSVFNQLTSAPNNMFEVLKREIGYKCDCLPFAVKAAEALRSLGNKLTEAEASKAANTFLSGWQTLSQGGIVAEDYDKVDFVKRGKEIVLSARVEAFMRAAARKGYRITETIVPVPKEDHETTYFKENFNNGEIVYTLDDRRSNGDRVITAQRLIDGYFTKFICRLEVREVKSNQRLLMVAAEMSLVEVMAAAAASDNGIFKSRWEEYKNDYGYTKKRRVNTTEINNGSIWNVWTAAMVEKTIIRRALKRVRETLPELKDTIYAFDPIEAEPLPQAEIEMDYEDNYTHGKVDLDNLTPAQQADADEMLAIYKANPAAAKKAANDIMEKFFEQGESAESLINAHYAEIVNIRKSKKLAPIIEPLFETPAETALCCEVCGKEITSAKSKKYHADNPEKPVKCYACNKGGSK
ncbi:MAG: hypothetical protein FWB96_01455 [Defluviitaleaceae bacterium]|nr:hypothetical protein [Defluviitaleaceae bacterium]MCL2261640.1 hypothetical protein [Defluviitaleaceae bacterium]